MTQSTVADMCLKHQSLLVRQARYSAQDPWRGLIVAAQIALFQAVTADPRIQRECAGEVERIAALGCMACQKPDAFGAIVQAASASRDFRAIKALGERWVQEAASGERLS